MILRPFFLGLIVAGATLAPLPAHAGTQDKLNKVESELDKHEEESAALDESAHAANETIKDLRQRLIAATEALQSKAAEEDELRGKLNDLTHDTAAKNGALGTERKKLDALMEAFMELSRQPPESLLLRTQLTDDHIHRAILLRTLVPRLREEANAITGDLADLAKERAQMVAQKRLVDAAQMNMQSQRHSLDKLIQARQGMLDRTQAQKEEIAKQLVALSSEARDLRQLMEEVTPKHAASSAIPRALRGSLKWPVAGRVMRGFGAKDADGVRSEGLTFTAPSSSPVVAPASGKVVFAGPFKGYGQIIILQHDGGYHSFLAGFGHIDADMGQDVEAGEPLGTLPAKDGGGRPELYFEWRRNGEPVDPGHK